MTFGELVKWCRRLLDEEGSKRHHWTTAELVSYAHDADKQIASRCKVIEDMTTPAVCTIVVTAGVAVYPLHPSILRITRVKYAGAVKPLEAITIEDMDRWNPSWETATGIPEKYMLGGGNMILSKLPATNSTINLIVKRGPVVVPTDQDLSLSPESPQRYHNRLYNWMLHLAYSKLDAEILNPQAAEKYRVRFEGPNPGGTGGDINEILKEELRLNPGKVRWRSC